MVRPHTAVIVCVAAALLSVSVMAQDEEERNRWSNNTELSLVVTTGNSEVLTLGFKNNYRKWWGPDKKSLFGVKLEGTRSDKADPREVEAQLDLTQPINPIEPCSSASAICQTLSPRLEDNIERFLAEGRFDRKFSKRTFWYALASWDRFLTDGSGVLNRYIGTAGLGNVWWDRDDLSFRTNYGVSYTDREETSPDPLKDSSFAGLRFDWNYLNKWGKNVEYVNTWTVNSSLEDSKDYNFDMINAVQVAISDRVALSISLQWLYNNFPPLEDVDLNCVNPDPTDQRTTVPCDIICVFPPGGPNAGLIDPDCLGTSIPLNDETKIRRKKSDLIFNTSLVIKL